MKAKKLIEVAMPIKEISAESVRDKSIRHGHISTLHLWWARRPLPVCRAVIFASLVPDPLDKNCPTIFREAIEIILGKSTNIGDPYKPYDDIPYTSAIDQMEDNLRNRLMMFIGKFSHYFIQNEKSGKKTPSKDIISDFSLIKWENKNNEEILNKARKLIWVAFNSNNYNNVDEALIDFDNNFNKIKIAEKEYYNKINRNVKNKENDLLEQQLKDSIRQFQSKMPKTFDPFTGGGAIPLEASRLGCVSYGNDINPVAHIIQKGSLEFPQKYGKPIIYNKEEFLKQYDSEALSKWCLENSIHPDKEHLTIEINNRLSFDVEFYSMKLLNKVKETISFAYPSNENGIKPIAYFWARVGICSNPTCKAEVPLLKNFYLANSNNRKFYLNPVISGNKIDFEIANGEYEFDGWISRGNFVCPCCKNATDVKSLKKQFIDGISKERLLAVIWEGNNGKEYKLPTNEEIEILNKIPNNIERPSEKMPTEYTQAMPSCTWGIKTWGQLFSDRQIFSMQSFVSSLNALKQEINHEEDYKKAIITYLAILVDRVSSRMTSFGLWHVKGEKLEQPFGRQAIPMIFDYPESNPLALTGGGYLNQLQWLLRYIDSEGQSPFISICNNASSGDKFQFDEKQLTVTITDPPYYDAIAYADLSDFFYVWLKRTLSDYYPENFATPQTPKTEECTALKHHHEGVFQSAKNHFENKLLQIFDAIEHQTSDIVSIMFAHQSTEAWTTLCNSILGAKMNITGSWAIDTELTGALKTDKAFLSSSVTVCARPLKREGFGNFKDVKSQIEKTIVAEVDELYKLGFRGSDLLTACFGQAVSEFGKFKHVEKADGSEVSVSELLEMTRESAFNALLKGFDADDFTKFYIGWLQLYGFTTNDHNTALRIVQIGLSIDINNLYKEHILIQNQNKVTLASFDERIKLNKSLGEKSNSNLIDLAHKAMSLYKGTSRNDLLEFISKNASDYESSFWRVLTSLCEILPVGTPDFIQANGLLTNKESLIKESSNLNQQIIQQGQLEF